MSKLTLEFDLCCDDMYIMADGKCRECQKQYSKNEHAYFIVYLEQEIARTQEKLDTLKTQKFAAIYKLPNE